MITEYFEWLSPILGQKFECKIYGKKGKPVLVFPTSKGRFFQFEDFGMLNPVKPLIEEEKIFVVAVDGVDWQSWWNTQIHPREKGKRHQEYDHSIYDEVIPFIRKYATTEQKVLTTGCSFGAYHSMNFFLKHPDVCDGVIAMSGVYTVKEFIGDYSDNDIYHNDPLAYLPNVTDPLLLECYRQSNIIICTGQGAWEDQFRASSQQLSAILTQKQISHWLDIWGYDVNHDWPWWQKQLPYFLTSLIEKKTI